MSRFLSRLAIQVADDTDNGQWVLVESLIYESDLAKCTIVVPKGFQTDLASVPRLPVIFLLTGNTSNEAAAVHDFLYSSHQVTREIADGILREASAVTGVPSWRRWAMWAGVRLGGTSHWDK